MGSSICSSVTMATPFAFLRLQQFGRIWVLYIRSETFICLRFNLIELISLELCFVIKISVISVTGFAAFPQITIRYAVVPAIGIRCFLKRI